MSQIFISYSHKDKKYARKLQEYLLRKGFDAWIDDRLEYGELWANEVEHRLRACKVFILLESPSAQQSKWVNKEVLLALKLNKTVFPILLAGEPRLEIIDLQWADGTNQHLPDARFLQRLRQIIPITSANSSASFPSESISIQVQGDVTGNIVVGAGNTVQTAQDLKHPEQARLFTAKKALVFPSLANFWRRVKMLKIFPGISRPRLPVIDRKYFIGIAFALRFILFFCILAIPMALLWYFNHPPTFFVHLTPASNSPGDFLDEKNIKMRLIRGEIFGMGSDNGNKNEKPFHAVDIHLNYYIDIYEVSNAAYQQCVKDRNYCSKPQSIASATSSSYYSDSAYANYPVVNVDWEQAKTYCEWRGARLPTEAEWEKAARGTDARLYPWGNSPLNAELANYGSNSGDTTAVWKFAAGRSPYGIFNMAGNVWEWVQDDYKNYPGITTSVDIAQSKILKGGSWQSSKNELRTSARLNFMPENSANSIGFRCARTAP